MLVYGKNVAKELLKNEKLINKVFLSKDFNDKDLNNLIFKKDLMVIYREKHEIDKLVGTPSQGIVIDIDDYIYTEFNEIENNKSTNFIVILDHIEDPHNFGAIIRTCECAGVDYIIIPNKGNIEVNSTVMKTSSGALTNVKICKVANLRNTIDKLKKLGFWIVGADADGKDYSSIDYNSKTTLVIGSEGKGLKQIVRTSCDFIASIPMKGQINSLNASVAAGIMIFEIGKSKN